MTAKFSREASFLVLRRSSSNVTSSVQWKISIPQWARVADSKPKGNDFIIDRTNLRPAVARHMSVTGG